MKPKRPPKARILQTYCELVRFVMLINIAIASLMMLFTTGLHVAGLSLVMVWIKAHAPNWRHRHAFARARKIGGVALLMFCLSIVEAFCLGGGLPSSGGVRKNRTGSVLLLVLQERMAPWESSYP